jgi:hypothetical protein
MSQLAKETYQIGGVSVTRVIERSAPTFSPDFLFPD